MCLSTVKPYKCPCPTEMNASQAQDVEASASDSRTFDENRCDSTELLEKELKLTAKKCSVMAEKLTKSGCIQKRRKQCDMCEHQIAQFKLLVASLENKVATLQAENEQLKKDHPQPQAGVLCVHQKAEISEAHVQPSTSVSNLRAENLKLRQLLKDVTEVNKRWQKYNRETQAYIQQLEEGRKELDSSSLLGNEVSPLDRRNGKLLPTSRHSDSQLEQTSGQTALHLRYESAVKEVCKLQKQVEESQRIQGALMEQLELLRKEKTEQSMLQEMQTKAFKEDWEAEKKEKVIAEEKASQLREEVKELQIELKDCKKRLKHIQATSSGPEPSENRGLWKKVMPTAPFHPKLTGIRSWANALTERGVHQVNNVGMLVADGEHETQKSQSAPSSWEDVRVNGIGDYSDDDDNALECPGCKKSFPRSLHLQFLDHFEECQATHVGT